MMNEIRALSGLILTSLALLAPAACTDDAGGDPQGSPLSPPPAACTQIGCDEGLVVELRPASGWPEGEYRFEIRADGAETTCRGTLPLTSCSKPNVTCDVGGVAQIAESGCAMPASTHSFPGIRFDPKLRPRRVEITIGLDDRIVGEARFSPSFRRIQPNGPQCPPVCDVATAVVELSF
jgi:hypothetical protein